MLDLRRILPLLMLCLVPAVVSADDDFEDLDVTMEVLDSEAELDVLVSQMRGPHRSAGEQGAADRDAPGKTVTEVDTGPFRENAEARDFDRKRRDSEAELLHEDDWETAEGEDQELDELPDEYYVEPDY